jgi:hypothetical protein
VRFGGSLRFFREKHKRDLLFGLNISGELLDPPAPDKQLDVWIRTGNLASTSGLPEADIRQTLQTEHPFLKEIKKGRDYVVRLQNTDQTQKLIEQLAAWTAPSDYKPE